MAEAVPPPVMSPALAALAVHDLKNALGSLEARLEALEQAPDAASAREARRLCQQLRREAMAFLTLYKGEALVAVVEDESPSTLLQALASDARRRGGAAQGPMDATVDIALDVQAAPPFWFLDARLVKLALDAALDNALRHARSRVTLAAVEQDGWLLLSVEDDGPGLQGGASSAAGAWQTGLGTALCRAVAEAHRSGPRRGDLTLADRDAGGARFVLRLP